jgi:hypothetical protein
LSKAVLAAAAMFAVHAHAADAADANRATMRAFVDTAYGQKQVREAYQAWVVRDLEDKRAQSASLFLRP